MMEGAATQARASTPLEGLSCRSMARRDGKVTLCVVRARARGRENLPAPCLGLTMGDMPAVPAPIVALYGLIRHASPGEPEDDSAL